jgi:hypothetical protein
MIKANACGVLLTLRLDSTGAFFARNQLGACMLREKKFRFASE